MGINRHEFAIPYTTAPSQRDPANNGQMLPIKLKLLSSGVGSEAKVREQFLAGSVDADKDGDFRRELPKLLAGESDVWTLWHIRMQPQRICFQFARREPQLPQPAASANPLDEVYPVNHAALTLVAPESLAFDFEVPPMEDTPGKSVHCSLCRQRELDIDRHETCTLRVTESVNGEVAFRYCLKTPYLG